MTKPTGHANFAQVGARWRRFLLNRRAIAKLAACPPSELRRMVQDVGLDERDLHSPCCSHPGPAELMPQRLQQLGLDPAFVKHALPTTYRDLERVCAHCKSWRRCARDLSHDDVQAGMDGYCLNATTIDALTVDRPISRRV